MAADHPLRIAAEQLCPGIRRDRAEGLYIAPAPLPQHPFFIQKLRGPLVVLLPSGAGVQALCGYFGPIGAYGFSRFEGRPLSDNDLHLLCEAVKLSETACSPAQAALYEKTLRRRAAVLLREHQTDEGGALPLCMHIAKTLVPRSKGE